VIPNSTSPFSCFPFFLIQDLESSFPNSVWERTYSRNSVASAAESKQSFADNGVPKLEFGNEGENQERT
ncbi:MAG: hypothetical protein ABI217_03685, partial [Chthoniobacterales bacterium]